jgi:hypothetical protein
LQIREQRLFPVANDLLRVQLRKQSITFG